MVIKSEFELVSGSDHLLYYFRSSRLRIGILFCEHERIHYQLANAYVYLLERQR